MILMLMGGPGLELWERSQRIGVRADIGVSHLLASSAIPFVFPPTKIGNEFFGDGAMSGTIALRQTCASALRC